MDKFNKIIFTIVFAAVIFFGLFLYSYAQGLPVFLPTQGGTGTGQKPTAGQVLVGQSNGTYSPQSESSVGVASVFGRMGAVTAQTGDYNTSQVPESGNLYFTNARAVSALTGQNISIFNNNAGYLTSLAGAASSTLLSDNNTFSGTNLFTSTLSNFAGTWQTFSPSHFQTALTFPLTLAQGGTATTTGGVTNGVEYFNGTNLTNGSGFTFDPTHLNVLIGLGNSIDTNSPYAGIFGGTMNAITSGESSVIVGGETNTNNSGGTENGIYTADTGLIENGANLSALIGGQSNTIDGVSNSSIIGGTTNVLTQGAGDSFILGGDTNEADGTESLILGSDSGIIGPDASLSGIIGGTDNNNDGEESYIFDSSGSTIGATPSFSTMVGGQTNDIEGGLDFIGGGTGNTVTGTESNVVGGDTNVIDGGGSENGIFNSSQSTIGPDASVSVIDGGGFDYNDGGESGIFSSDSSIIGTSSADSVIIGGQSNTVAANKNFSSIFGGRSNTINGSDSEAFGQKMTINANNSVGFGLDGNPYTITANKVFDVLGGNVGIGTTTPYSRLSVWGPDTANTTAFAVVNSASTTEFKVDDAGNVTAPALGTGCVSAASGLLSAGAACGTASFSGTTGQVGYFNGTNSSIGTSTIFISTASRVGVGTTSPIATLDVETASSTAGTAQTTPWSQLIAQTIAGVWYKISTYDYYGHHITSGPTTSLGTCGSSSSVSGNDNNGTITVSGVAVTSCTMNFAKPWPSAPDCTESDSTTASVADIASVSATSITFGLSVGINSGSIYYQCVDHQ